MLPFIILKNLTIKIEHLKLLKDKFTNVPFIRSSCYQEPSGPQE